MAAEPMLSQMGHEAQARPFYKDWLWDPTIPKERKKKKDEEKKPEEKTPPEPKKPGPKQIGPGREMKAIGPGPRPHGQRPDTAGELPPAPNKTVEPYRTIPTDESNWEARQRMRQQWYHHVGPGEQRKAIEGGKPADYELGDESVEDTPVSHLDPHDLAWRAAQHGPVSIHPLTQTMQEFGQLPKAPEPVRTPPPTGQVGSGPLGRQMASGANRLNPGPEPVSKFTTKPAFSQAEGDQGYLFRERTRSEFDRLQKQRQQNIQTWGQS